jgi:hypothetical protein
MSYYVMCIPEQVPMRHKKKNYAGPIQPSAVQYNSQGIILCTYRDSENFQSAFAAFMFMMYN